jgi:cell division transport system permease protein
MFTIISRIFHFGFLNFKRNGLLSVATVAIITLALFVFGGLIMFGVITNNAVASIQDKIDISVYFNTNTPEDQILNIQQSLQGLPQVASVDYISRDKALDLFKAKHANDSTITQAINELNSNPLEASLNIKAKSPDQYATIANYLSSSTISQYVDTVSYAQNQDVINRLAKIIKNIESGALLAIIFLTFIAGLVVFNTIRIAIYSNRDEIGIMRVVGASNNFITGPYMVEGFICGTIAALFSIIIAAPIMYFISPYLDVFIPGLNIFQYFYTHIFQLFFYEFIFGILIGIFSSYIAVKKYLKN